jgi:hypothetical protein
MPVLAQVQKDLLGHSDMRFHAWRISGEAANRDVVIPRGEVKAGVRRVLGRREGVSLTHVNGWSRGESPLLGREIDSSVSDGLGAVASHCGIKQEVM